MPSATLQSRINLFEQSSSSSVPLNTPRSPSSQTLLLESPLSPTITSIKPIAPSTASSPEFMTNASLIDLKDWVIDDKHYSNHTYQHSPPSAAPLIHLQSPPRHNHSAPPLPPRKPSYTSLKSVSSTSSSPPLKLPSRRTDSLTVDYSYPPNGRSKHTSSSPGHMPASSVSSFHSISLSSDGEPMTPASNSGSKLESSDTGASSRDSTNESFEEVSASSIISPSKAALLAKQGGSSRPPQLPRRPSSKSTPSTPPTLKSSQSSSSTTTIRRAPPPRPPSSPRNSLTASSDRSSIRSSTTSIASRSSSSSRVNVNKLSSQKAVFPAKRPTPIPPAARARFELVFNRNLQQQQKFEQQRLIANYGAEKRKTGWRGLSVDLITDPEIPKRSPGTGSNESNSDGRLDGYAVRAIWSRSKLDKLKLGTIWDECDIQHRGSLDQEEFIRGMWRIDEELGRARLRGHKVSAGLSTHSNTRTFH